MSVSFSDSHLAARAGQLRLHSQGAVRKQVLRPYTRNPNRAVSAQIYPGCDQATPSHAPAIHAPLLFKTERDRNEARPQKKGLRTPQRPRRTHQKQANVAGCDVSSSGGVGFRAEGPAAQSIGPACGAAYVHTSHDTGLKPCALCDAAFSPQDRHFLPIPDQFQASIEHCIPCARR